MIIYLGEVRERFFKRQLILDDIVRYEEVYKKMNGRGGYDLDTSFWSRISFDELKKIDLQVYKLHPFSGAIMQEIKKIKVDGMLTAEDINNVIYNKMREEIYRGDIVVINEDFRKKLSEQFIAQNQDLFLADDIQDEELAREFYSYRGLSIESIYFHKEILRGKKYRLDYNISEFLDLIGEDIDFIIENFSLEEAKSYIGRKKTIFSDIDIDKFRRMAQSDKIQAIQVLSKRNDEIENLSDVVILQEFVPIEKIKFGSKECNDLIRKYGPEAFIKIGINTSDDLVKMLYEDNLERIKQYSQTIDLSVFFKDDEAEVIKKYGIDWYLEQGFGSKYYLTNIRQSGISIEEMEKIANAGVGLDALIGNQEMLQFINTFGIENLKRLNEESGNMFSSENIKASQSLVQLAQGYALLENKIEPNIQVTYEEFVGKVAEIVKTLREKGQPISQMKNLSQNVQELIPDEFLSGEEVEKIQRMQNSQILYFDNISMNDRNNLIGRFYTNGLTTKDIFDYPELVDILKEKNIEHILKINAKKLDRYEEVAEPVMRDDGKTYFETFKHPIYENMNFSQFFCDKFGREEFLKLCTQYGLFLDNSTIYINNEECKLEEAMKAVEKAVYERIMNPQETNSHENLGDEFKKKYPELYLDYDVPEEIKRKFYSKSLVIGDFRNPEIQKAMLEGKKIELGFAGYFALKPNMKNLYSNVSREQFLELFNIYGEYLEDVGYIRSLYTRKDKDNFFDELKSEIESEIEKNILNRTSRLNVNVPQFFKEKYPQYIITGLNEEDLRNYYVPELNLKQFFERFQGEKLEAFKEKDVSLVFEKKYQELWNTYSIEEVINNFSTCGESLDKIVSRREIGILKKAYEMYGIDAANSPELLHLIKEEQLPDINFANYLDLVKKSNFHLCKEYRKDNAEQLVAKMYLLFGYDKTAELFKIPEMSMEELSRAIEERENEFDEACEVRFKLKGDIQVVTELFRKLDLSEYTSGNKKAQFEIFKNLNQKLEDGFDGDFKELLSGAIQEAGSVPNEQAIEELYGHLNAILTNQKMVKINPYYNEHVNTILTATGANKKIISDILISEIRKSFIQTGNIDESIIENVRKEIMERQKEDGTPYYSPHVRDHMGEVEEIFSKILNDEDIQKISSYSIVNSLMNEKNKIGKGWIRKVLNVPTELSLEEIKALEGKLYGEDEDREIEYEKRVIVRNSKGKSNLPEDEKTAQEKAYTLLENLGNQSLITIDKAEVMFDKITPPYSEKFVEFFMAHKDEILANPNYYTKISKLHNSFDKIIELPEIKNRYEKGLVGVQGLIDLLDNKVYDNVQEGEWELATRAGRVQMQEKDFPHAQRILAEIRKREYQTVPTVKNKVAGKYRGRIVRSDDPLHIVAGDITTCCQGFYGAGEASMMHSGMEKNGSLFVVEELDEYGNVVNIVAQSWTWRNNDRVCFDNVEIPDTLAGSLSKENYEEITRVYQEAARGIIITDAKFMKKMLDEGKITKEQYDRLTVKQVTVGTGCNDLITLDEKGRFKQAQIVAPHEANKMYLSVSGYQKVPWIDSKFPLIFADIEEVKDEIEQMPIQSTEKVYNRDLLEEIPIGYGFVRDVIIHKDLEINPDDLKGIRDLQVRASQGKKSSFGNFTSVSDLKDELETENLKLRISRDKDWYILSSEDETAIKIEGIAKAQTPPIEESVNEQGATNNDSTNRAKQELAGKIASLELASNFYDIMLEAVSKRKEILISSQNDLSGLNYNQLVEKGIIQISESRNQKSITILDREKLEEEAKRMKEILERQEEILMLQGKAKKKTEALTEAKQDSEEER